MRFTENHRLGDIIAARYQLLLLLSRFGIPLGFGDKTVADVCRQNGVHCPTFLAVANYLVSADSSLFRQVDIRAMIGFLRLAHQYYLDFLLPNLRDSLLRAVGKTSDATLSDLVVKLFDDYVGEVRRHLSFEDKRVFDYSLRLADGLLPEGGVRFASFIRQHDNIDSRLSELKNVMIKYFPAAGALREVNQVLYDIFACEEDLKAHCDIEDNLFVPAVVLIERQLVCRADND